MDNEKDYSKKFPNTNKEEYEVGGDLNFDDDDPSWIDWFCNLFKDKK